MTSGTTGAGNIPQLAPIDYHDSDMLAHDPTTTTNDPPRSIAFLLVEDFALFSYASAVEPLRAANHLAGRRLYELGHYSIQGNKARASSGAIIPCDGETGASIRPDILLVCAGGDLARFYDARCFAWLRRLASRGVILGGISGGPLILARAGVMEGRRLTVHWEYAADLAERHPHLSLTRALYVIDRDRITCGGGTAAMDLMHFLITRDHGAAFARSVSDWFLHTQVRSAGSAQKLSAAERHSVSHPALVAALEVMEAHIGDPLPQEAIAESAGVSTRQLRRLFRQRLLRSAAEVYRDLRLDHARDLLRQTTLSVAEIGLACGFSSSAHFVSAFRRRFRTTPAADRGRRAG